MRGLIIIGLLIIIAGLLLMVSSFYVAPITSGEGAACIILGPIPICFVGGGVSNEVLLIGFVIILVIIIFMLYIFWKSMRIMGGRS
jgi:uncharacterized membrane protein